MLSLAQICIPPRILKASKRPQSSLEGLLIEEGSEDSLQWPGGSSPSGSARSQVSSRFLNRTGSSRGPALEQPPLCQDRPAVHCHLSPDSPAPWTHVQDSLSPTRALSEAPSVNAQDDELRGFLCFAEAPPTPTRWDPTLHSLARVRETLRSQCARQKNKSTVTIMYLTFA